MPNLNPFAKKAGPPTSARVGDDWKMPSLFSSSSKPARKPAGPSTWQKMTRGTKSFASKTADVLNPFDDANDKRTTQPSITGTNSYFSQAANRKPAEKKSSSFLPSWVWGEEKEEKKIETVTDFLALPRPGY